MVKEFYLLLNAWRKQDRIRSSPGLGTLLRLQPCTQLFICQTLYQVVQRDQTSDSSTLAVTYQLIDADQLTPAQLCVAIDRQQPTRGQITLDLQTSIMEVCYQDVTVLGLAGPHGYASPTR